MQTTTSVIGSVTDMNGGLIPGAEVVLVNQETGATQSSKTNAAGAYTFLGIQPGTYSIKASFQGFQSVEFNNRAVFVAQPAIVDFKLQPGNTVETITVNAASASLLDQSTAEVSGEVNQHLVANMPLNGRDFMDLAAMTPGTSSTTALGTKQITFAMTTLNNVQAAGLVFTSSAILGGNRDTATNVSIDGSNVQVAHMGQIVQLQSPADVESVKTESGVMNPEFGFGTGAVNTITKSGTNVFHGEAYEFLRNSALDANDYFNNLAGIDRPTYRLNQFGAAVGGPILHNKLHFFANYEGMRVSQATGNIENTPPDSLRNGTFDFAEPGVPAPVIYNPYRYDPTTGLREPFPNNQIPMGTTDLCAPRPTCVDPAMVAYLKYTPEPTPGKIVNGQWVYTNTTPTTINQNQYTVRIDWDKGDKTHIFGRFTHFKDASLASGFAPIAGTESPYGSENPLISWVQEIGSNSVNNLTLGYMRGSYANKRATDGIGDISNELGLNNTSSNPGGPGIADGDYTHAASGYDYTTDLEDNLQLSEDYSLSFGNHTFKVGFQDNNRRAHWDAESFDKGQLIYQGIYTTACPQGNSACAGAMTQAGIASNGGMAFADYLLGTAEEARLSVPGSIYNAYQNYIGAYAQDTWRLTRRLTLNYGLRYDYWTPWTQNRRMTIRWDDATGNVVYALQNPLDYLDPKTGYGRRAALTPGANGADYTTGAKDFSPRVGVAYRLTNTTVIRAGAGIYFDGNGNLNQISNVQSLSAAPFSLATEAIGTGQEQLPPIIASEQFSPPSASSVLQPDPSNPPSIRAMAGKYYPTPTVDQWTASVQQQLGKEWVAELTYLGTHTVHELQYVDMNVPDLPIGDKATLSEQQRRPVAGYAGVGTWGPYGFARYNALIASIKTPRWQGLTLMSWFSFSRDMVSSPVGVSDDGVFNRKYISLWAGPSLINPSLRNVNSWNYALPVGREQRFKPNRALNYLIGEWQFSGMAEFSQGGHQFINTSVDSTASGQDPALADLVPNCDTNHPQGGRTISQWFNKSCYTIPAFGYYGNSKLGSFVMPGVENLNVALEKGFPIPKLDSHRLDFRAEFFNAFNHTQWADVATWWEVSNPGTPYGKVQSAQTPRQIQFSLKYLF